MFFDLIRTRRSIRKFSSRPVEKEKTELLIEAALRSPSSRGFNPWRFIVVNEPELIEKLSRAKPHGSSFLKNAPLAIVVCSDVSASDVCVEDASIASIFIHLAAHNLDLGSCWIQIRKRDHSPSLTADAYIKEILKLPDNLMVESILAIGYPAETKNGHPLETLEFEKVFFNQFTTKV